MTTNLTESPQPLLGELMVSSLQKARESLKATASANDAFRELQESVDLDSLVARERLNQALVNGTLLAVMEVLVEGMLIVTTVDPT